MPWAISSSAERGRWFAAADLRRFAFAAAVACAVLWVAIAALRFEPARLVGDEGTFVAMAASLARDGDLRFTAEDLTWAVGRPEPPGLILQRVGDRLFYSKPVLYPLLAAPWLALFGEGGLLLFHAVLLAAAAATARAALARRQGGARALETLLCFAFASIGVPHLGWRATETLQVALALAGLALTLGGELPGDGSFSDARSRLTQARSYLLGASLLGLLVALREPNALIAAVPVAAAVFARRWRRAAELAAATAAVYGLVVLATFALAGAPNPYKAVRATFDAESGYPVGSGAATVFSRFDVDLATTTLTAVPRFQADRSAYAALYFVVGRHAGLLAYFPAALALLWAAWRSGSPGLDRVGRAALLGFGASALFYLVWWPENYFGGATHLGNRYLLAAYPCLLFVPRTLPTRRALAVAWSVALAFGLSALVSVARTHAVDPTSQSHTHAGLFRLLPYESVASAIDGRRDRYWSSDFLRFVDPFARADASSFELASGAPAAEVEIATAWAGTPLSLLVVADTPDATLVVSDWLGSERHRLTPDDFGRSGGVVRFEPSSAWRRHRFWWSEERAYRARFVRFRLDAPEGATARLRYLGRADVPASGFGRELAAPLELPGTVRARARFALELALRNTGAWPWSSSESLPVLVGARWQALDREAPALETRALLPEVVVPGGRVSARLRLDAPRAPGRYRLTVDLVMEDVAWFSERVGAPLAERIVTVSE